MTIYYLKKLKFINYGNKNQRIITVLGVLLAILVAVVSFLGAFYPLTYVRDSASIGA